MKLSIKMKITHPSTNGTSCKIARTISKRPSGPNDEDEGESDSESEKQALMMRQIRISSMTTPMPMIKGRTWKS